MPGTSAKSTPLSVRVPNEMVERLPPAGRHRSEVVVDALARYLGQPPRWRPLLGDALADRVAAVAGDDPGAFCLRAIETAVRTAERKARDASTRDTRRR